MNDIYQRIDAAAFPEIGGVRLFVPRPRAALQAFLGDLGVIQERFASTTAELEAAKPRLDASLRRRAERSIAGMAHDLRVMQDAVAPVREALGSEPADDDFIAWASIQTGLSLHDMFIYFYHDWYGTPDFAQVKAWFDGAVDAHCPDRTNVAVLGAGACGLAHALAFRFGRTYAVDLSLPTLLLARRYIEGQRLALHLKQASWVRAELAPPARAPNPIEYVAANVTHLPFRDGSLACVVTQCLFDIVDNPLHLAEEIQRVLRPGAVWINFSHAFDAPGDPLVLSPRKLEEVPPVLEPIGFDTVSLERKRFIMLNLETIAPEPPRTDEEVHFFVLRKSERAPTRRFSPLRARFEREDAALWQARPRTIPGKEVSISERRSFAAGMQTQTELRVGPYAMPIPDAHAEVLALLLEQVDGEKTLRDIFVSLEERGVPLSASSFLELVSCLSVERYLLDLGAPGR